MYHFTKSLGFSNNIIYSIAIDKENCIWVATGGDGLKKINLQNSTITTITTEEGLAEMTVTSVVALENKVYAGTAKGLSVIELKNKNVSIQNYDKLQGFRTRDFNSNAILLTANKSIWWGIGDMLTIYKPADKKFLPHQTNFTGIDVMGKELEFNSVQNFINKLNVTDTIWTSARDTFYFKNSFNLDTVYKSNNNMIWKSISGPYNMPKELQLPYNQNHITFHFTGNQLSNPDKTKYRYILEGTEKKWNPIVTVAFADYRNLSPGKYIFKVSSNNFGGPWSEPVEMSLTIAPPWWKTKLAYIFYIILLLGSIFTYNRINTERLRKRQKELEAVVDERTKEVVKQKNEIEIQKQTVEEKQKEIVDSINYAKRIQYTLLAHEKVLKKHFSDHFVLFQPKDIVSGDFYWATKKIINAGLNFNANEETTVQVQNAKTELFYLAVCDSTGHGVPGAFMSLLNISFINEAINERNIFSPDEILNYVRQRLIKSVSREGGQDGMDGILLCFESPIKEQETDNAINENQKKIKLTYAAGNNSPLLFNNGTLSELPANKMPIGKGEKTEAFTLYTIDATKGDIIYLTTDGFADQFGGPKGKKFKTKKLTALLQDHAHETMDKQHEIILNVLKNWKGDLEQIDDICLLGIKL